MRMSEYKEQRQRAIADLIRNHDLASQEEVAERLASLGFVVTQATVSRDLEQLGALKVRRQGRVSYALPAQIMSAPAPSRLSSVLRDWVRSIEPAGNLLVMRTPPGSAHLVGVELDQAALPQIVGTICGDDTLFVACRSADDAMALVATLNSPSSAGLQ
jgi:transcriptional regulator of arginine metabolism